MRQEHRKGAERSHPRRLVSISYVKTLLSRQRSSTIWPNRLSGQVALGSTAVNRATRSPMRKRRKAEKPDPQSDPQNAQVLYDFGGLRRSPRVCKSLKNLKTVDCHGRGRGFEPRRPRHTFQKTYLELAEFNWGAKGTQKCAPFAPQSRSDASAPRNRSLTFRTTRAYPIPPVEKTPAT